MAKQRNFALRVSTLAIVGAMVTNCTTEESDGNSGPPPDVLSVTTGEGTLNSSGPAIVELAFGSSSSAQISITAQGNGKQWTATAALSPTVSELQEFEVVLTDPSAGPMTEGTGTVTFNGTSATEGFLRATIAHGKIQGTVSGAGDLNATINGAVSVECRVPSSDLPSDAGGLTPDDAYADVDILSTDRNFVTPQCSPFEELQR